MVWFVRVGHPLGPERVENCGFLGFSQQSYMWFKVAVVGQGHHIGSEMVEKWCLYGLFTLFLFQFFGFNRLGLKCMDYLYCVWCALYKVEGCISKRIGASSRCILCIQASQAVALTMARVQYMADEHILLSPREDYHRALADILQGEVFDSLKFFCIFVCLCFLFVSSSFFLMFPSSSFVDWCFVCFQLHLTSWWGESIWSRAQGSEIVEARL